MRELSLVRIQQGFQKEKIKQKIKSVHSGYRELAIGIKGIQYSSITLTNYYWLDIFSVAYGFLFIFAFYEDKSKLFDLQRITKTAYPFFTLLVFIIGIENLIFKKGYTTSLNS